MYEELFTQDQSELEKFVLEFYAKDLLSMPRPKGFVVRHGRQSQYRAVIVVETHFSVSKFIAYARSKPTAVRKVCVRVLNYLEDSGYQM